MKYNQYVYDRKSIRLKNYNYSQKGLYFITISTQNKLCLFGNIKNKKIKLNKSGQMIAKYWLELEKKYNTIKLHEYIIMPNHFHGIIQIKYKNSTVEADLRVCSDDQIKSLDDQIKYFCNKKIEGTHKTGGTHRFTPTGGFYIKCKNDIPSIIQWFKTITTNEYIKMVKNGISEPFYKKLWQRNYYEHIIKNEESYIEISKYIENNPLKWKEDKFYYT